MNLTKNRLKDIQKNGYQLDFSTVFNHAFENYKKIALYAGLAFFVFTIFFMFLVAVLLASFFDIARITEYLKPENVDPKNFTLNVLLIYIFIMTLLTAILSPFTAGFLKMAHCAEKDSEFHVSTLFQYYKAPYCIQIITASVLLTLTSLSIKLFLDRIGIIIVGDLISIVLSFFTFLTIPLIIFGELNAIEAIKTSTTIVLKQPLLLVALLIIATIGSIVGVIGCCIGLFFTIPFIYAMYYAIYSAIVGIDSEDDLD
jgi:hypothetical protein